MYTCLNKSLKHWIPTTDSAKFLTSFICCDDLLVELLCKNEIGGGPGDGDEAANGSRVRDTQRQTLADHLVLLGRVHGVSPDFGFLWDRNID